MLTNSFAMRLPKSYERGLALAGNEMGVLYPVYPLYPWWHTLIGNHVSPRQDHECDTRGSKLERVIEIGGEHADTSKEETQTDVSNHDEEVKHKECPRRAIQS